MMRLWQKSCVSQLLHSVRSCSDSGRLVPQDPHLINSHSLYTLKLMEKKFILRRHGAQLWTREKARQIRSQLASILEGLEAGDVLVIDTTGVEVFDFSFAN